MAPTRVVTPAEVQALGELETNERLRRWELKVQRQWQHFYHHMAGRARAARARGGALASRLINEVVMGKSFPENVYAHRPVGYLGAQRHARTGVEAAPQKRGRGWKRHVQQLFKRYPGEPFERVMQIASETWHRRADDRRAAVRKKRRAERMVAIRGIATVLGARPGVHARPAVGAVPYPLGDGMEGYYPERWPDA